MSFIPDTHQGAAEKYRMEGWKTSGIWGKVVLKSIAALPFYVVSCGATLPLARLVVSDWEATIAWMCPR